MERTLRVPDAVAPKWVPIAGAVSGLITLLFFIALVLLATLTHFNVPPDARFLVLVVLALGAAMSVAFLGGAAIVEGKIPIPGLAIDPIAFSAGGGIAVLIIVLLIGYFLYIEPYQPLTAGTQYSDQILIRKGTGDDSRAVFPNGTVVALIDVDTLSDNKFVSVLNDISTALWAAENQNATGLFHSQLEETFQTVVDALEFSPLHSAMVLTLIDDYKKGEANIDSRWEEIVDMIAKGSGNEKLFKDRVNRMPFAILRIEKKDLVGIEVVHPTKTITVGNDTFGIPIIANPKRKAVPELFGALVLERRKQSQE